MYPYNYAYVNAVPHRNDIVGWGRNVSNIVLHCYFSEFIVCLRGIQFFFFPCSFILVMEIQKKLVIVGDSACGKTNLTVVFDNKKFPEIYIPTLFEEYFINSKVNHTSVNLHINDTGGEKNM